MDEVRELQQRVRRWVGREIIRAHSAVDMGLNGRYHISQISRRTYARDRARIHREWERTYSY